MSAGFIGSFLCDGHGGLLSPDGNREVLFDVISAPVDLRNYRDGCAGSDSDWSEEVGTMVPNASTSVDCSIVVPIWCELACRSIRAGSLDVLALFVYVGRDVNSLSYRGCYVECRSLAGSTAIAAGSCDTNSVTITTSHPVSKLPVGRVVVVRNIREVRLEISGGHEEGSIVFIDESNSCGFGGVCGPEGIRVCICADPFALTPRVANLEDLCAIVQGVGCNERVGMSSDDAVKIS